MTGWRPVDGTGLAERVFDMTRPEALRLGICIRCKRDIEFWNLTPVYAREYAFSAIGPCCWPELVLGDEWVVSKPPVRKPRAFTCIVCGTEDWDTGVGRRRLYCSAHRDPAERERVLEEDCAND